MGIVLVEICDGNLMTEVDLEGIIESEYPEVDVIENTCLNQCGMCAVRPFALVNNRRIFGKTPEQCVEKIKKAIDEELAAFNEF
ncbi:YuzB family protein [Alkalibacillus haloalkaliphilus]|uniref:YuzB family protein n=1 Tax=Alkalibacillus haloalkaliphilus TaxID=94136 RepID=UPI0002D87DFB|nr:YuzB family protein [Alkalibacillus haloalkaliphilus]